MVPFIFTYDLDHVMAFANSHFLLYLSYYLAKHCRSRNFMVQFTVINEFDHSSYDL